MSAMGGKLPLALRRGYREFSQLNARSQTQPNAKLLRRSSRRSTVSASSRSIRPSRETVAALSPHSKASWSTVMRRNREMRQSPIYGP